MAASSIAGGIAGSRVLRRITTVIAVIILIGSIVTAPLYPGNTSLYLLFGAVFSVAIAVSGIGRLSYFQLFLTAFLALGFWAKLVLHLISRAAFIEPIGRFARSSEAWDHAMLAPMAGVGAVALVGGLLKFVDRGALRPDFALAKSKIFRHVGWPVFWLSASVAVALFALSLRFAIIQIGINPKIELSSDLYVIIAFTVSWGAALWLDALGFWLFVAGRLSAASVIYIAALEGALAAVAMGSRAQMILHTLPAIVAVLIWAPRIGGRTSGRSLGSAVAASVAIFVGSLLLVSGERLMTFPATTSVAPAVPGEGVVSQAVPMKAPWPSPLVPPFAAQGPVFTARAIQGSAKELSSLIVDRWVGLEGVLAVSSDPDLGPSLLEAAAAEKPEVGVDAIYQKIAHSQYVRMNGYTFMTIPGAIAVLLYSGSLTIVGLGMAAIFLTGYGIERFADLWVRNPIASAIVGSALGYLVVQLNFPWTLLIFCLELILALGLVGLARVAVGRWARPPG